MGGGNNSSAEMLLPGEKQQPNIAILNTQHLETNYLATELDRDGDASLLSSAEVSPREHTDRRLNTSDVFSVAPDINNATSSRMTKARYIRHKKTRELERKYRKATGDTKTDFVDYLEFLVQFFKITERLDAAGCTLQKVFGLVSEDGDDIDSTGEEGSSDQFHDQSEAEKRTMFKYWLLNLDVYGSFEPLTPQCYDIQMARSAAFTKLVQMKRRFRKMIEFWEELTEESGMLMHRLLAQVELIDFYLSKIEYYFSKKQHED